MSVNGQHEFALAAGQGYRLVKDQQFAADLADGKTLPFQEQFNLNVGRVTGGRGGIENVWFFR